MPGSVFAHREAEILIMVIDVTGYNIHYHRPEYLPDFNGRYTYTTSHFN